MTGCTGHSQSNQEKDLYFHKLMKQGSSDEQQEMNSNFSMAPAVINDVVSEDQNGKEDTIVDCEPSLEVEEEPSQEDTSLKFQQKTKTFTGELLNEDEAGRDIATSPKRSGEVSIDDLTHKSKTNRKIHSEGGFTPASLLNIEKIQSIFHKEKTQPDAKENRVKIRSYSPNPRVNTGII